MVYHKSIYSIVFGVILLAAITCGGIRRLVRLRDASETYMNSTPSLYIAAPHQAIIYVVQDPHDLSSKQPLWTDNDYPPMQIWQQRTIDPERPLFIARYPQGNTAVWCAVRPDEQEKTIKHVSKYLCNGFPPVTELLSKGGKLLHFSTQDNRFLHIFVENGTMGCSYNETLLTRPAADTSLKTIAENRQKLSKTGIIYYNDGYKYLAIEQTDSTVIFRRLLHTLPEFIDGKELTFQTSAITRSVQNILQASCRTNENLEDFLILASTDSSPSGNILTVNIKNESALRQWLKGCFTSDGYKTSREKLSEWLPAEWLQSNIYWLAIRNNTLFISPSHKALWLYIHELQWNNSHLLSQEYEPAVLTLLTKGNAPASQWLPQAIADLLPPITYADKLILQIFITGKEGYRTDITASSAYSKSPIVNP